MPVEIERKFLTVPSFRIEDIISKNAKYIVQGYLSRDPSIRVRILEAGQNQTAFLTVKGPGKLSRQEFEYEIPVRDAREMMFLTKNRVEKIRHLVDHEGHTWEVDEFLGSLQGLWLAEIELADEDETFITPIWVGDEVTDDGRYSNSSLAVDGWPS